jgi:hypothetical protein
VLNVRLVDNVGAGRSDGDQLQLRKLLQHLLAHRDLVDDRDRRVFQAVDDILGSPGRLVLRVIVRKIGLADIGADRLAIEEDDLVFH